jgi:hypothetical protein
MFPAIMMALAWPGLRSAPPMFIVIPVPVATVRSTVIVVTLTKVAT